MASFNAALLVISVVFVQVFANTRETVVQTAEGKLRGKILNDRKGQIFLAFHSIPYAKPPIGELRFKAPEAAEAWTGILDATKNSPECSQHIFFHQQGRKSGPPEGQEDCLYLNVFTKKINPTSDDNLKAVMVYIHGGGFIEGAAEDYGAEYLITEDIVLVVLNYRLGLFGFVSFKNQSSGIPGNAGLKDQVMALKWVQRNIRNFGGDPSKVTIFGESAGGASVHLHMLSPMSKGLFHKAISQSGTALAPWSYGVLGTGDMLVKNLGIQDNDMSQVVKKLQELPTERIFEQQSNIIPTIVIHTPWAASPVVEKQTNEPAFLPDERIKIIESGNYNHVPYMTGCTSSEGIFLEILFLILTGKTVVEKDVRKSVPYDLHLENKQDVLTEVINKIKEFYYRDKTPTDDSVQEYINIVSDAWFFYPAYRTATIHLKTASLPLYFYWFSADTKLNIYKRRHNGTCQYPGATHVDDLGYLFTTRYAEEIEEGSVEDLCLDRVVKLWTNFAKYDDPTPNRFTGGDVDWKPVTREKFNYLNIGTNELESSINPNNDSLNFWNLIYKNFAQNH